MLKLFDLSMVNLRAQLCLKCFNHVNISLGWRGGCRPVFPVAQWAHRGKNICCQGSKVYSTTLNSTLFLQFTQGTGTVACNRQDISNFWEPRMTEIQCVLIHRAVQRNSQEHPSKLDLWVTELIMESKNSSLEIKLYFSVCEFHSF